MDGAAQGATPNRIISRAEHNASLRCRGEAGVRPANIGCTTTLMLLAMSLLASHLPLVPAASHENEQGNLSSGLSSPCAQMSRGVSACGIPSGCPRIMLMLMLMMTR